MSEAKLPPRRRLTVAEHKDLSWVVVFYALGLSVVLAGVAALVFGIAWSDIADNAGPSF